MGSEEGIIVLMVFVMMDLLSRREKSLRSAPRINQKNGNDSNDRSF